MPISPAAPVASNAHEGAPSGARHVFVNALGVLTKSDSSDLKSGRFGWVLAGVAMLGVCPSSVGRRAERRAVLIMQPVFKQISNGRGHTGINLQP